MNRAIFTIGTDHKYQNLSAEIVKDKHVGFTRLISDIVLARNIELISEERAHELHPSCMIVLIWFFKDEVIKREREYLEKGGSLLFPMPYCHVVTKDGERRL